MKLFFIEYIIHIPKVFNHNLLRLPITAWTMSPLSSEREIEMLCCRIINTMYYENITALWHESAYTLTHSRCILHEPITCKICNI